jgi:hypothetical protein
METIGITPQRLGEAVEQPTATGLRMAIANSYAQTEQYFIQHSDYLMPRVHKMRTDIAQYYHSTNPSIRLQYMTTVDEKINFQMNGTDLMLRDINIFCTTKTNQRQILEQLKQLAMTNNTTGASIYDLGNIVKADNIAEVTHILKDAEAKQQALKQQEMQQMQQMKEQEIQAKQQEAQMKLQFEQEENEKERQKDITVAEIRAAGYGSMQDINQNQQSDFQDYMVKLRQEDRIQEQLNLKKEDAINKRATSKEKMQIEREKLATQRDVANKKLEVAKENKNRYDVPPKKDS